MQFLDTLNPEQREAVLHTKGPLLILAGAGSGKTRVITSRIAYLVGDGHAKPNEVLAVTFTNKAAEEIAAASKPCSGRTYRHVGVDVPRVVRPVAPPRSAGDRAVARLRDLRLVRPALRRQAGAQGAADRRQHRSAARGAVANQHAKNRMEGPDDVAGAAGWNRRDEQIAKVYAYYLNTLKESSALDFDDLLLKTVEVFEQSEQVRTRYAQQFRYVMVDEYQDTNRPQYLLIRRLAEVHRNLCVVGDPDQSIYKWRGADLRNILDFEQDFGEAKDHQARTELPLDAGDSRCRLGGHQPESQPQGQAALDDRNGGERIAYFRGGDELKEADYITRTARTAPGRRRRDDGRGALPDQRAVAGDRGRADARTFAMPPATTPPRKPRVARGLAGGARRERRVPQGLRPPARAARATCARRRCARIRVDERLARPSWPRSCASCATASGYESLGIGYAALALRAAPASRHQRALGCDRRHGRPAGAASLRAAGRREGRDAGGAVAVAESYGVKFQVVEPRRSAGARGSATTARPGPRCWRRRPPRRPNGRARRCSSRSIPAAIRCNRRPRRGSGTIAACGRWRRSTSRRRARSPRRSGGGSGCATPRRWPGGRSTRRGRPTPTAASRAEAAAVRELALCDRGVLAPEDLDLYDETARPGGRLALGDRDATQEKESRARKTVVSFAARAPGETCVRLTDAAGDRRRSSASVVPSASSGRARSAGRRRAISPRWPSSRWPPGPSSGFCAGRPTAAGASTPSPPPPPIPTSVTSNRPGFRPTAAACWSSVRFALPATSLAGFRSCSRRRCRSRNGPAAPTSWSPSSAGARHPGGPAPWRCGNAG